MKLIYKLNYILIFFIFVCFVGCKQRIISPAKLQIERKLLDQAYIDYRDAFFSTFLDEQKNRFNGCVVEKIKVDKNSYLLDPFNLEPKQYTFGDGTVYAGFTLCFLGFDYAYWIDKEKPEEAERTLKMILRVLAGVEKCDKDSINGQNGFLYRDTVDDQKGLVIDSDFNSKTVDDKDMSQSQIAALFIGFDFLLTVIDREDFRDEQFIEIKERIVQQMERMVQYLIKNDFVIHSEICVGKKVSRGAGVNVSGWIFVQLLKKWLPEEKRNALKGGSRLKWKMGASAAYSFYSLPAPEVKDYKDALKYNKELKCRSWRVNYFQSLVVALHPNMERLNHLEPDWQPWVGRYLNGLAVSLAMAKNMHPNDKLKKILFLELSQVPLKHLPDNFHKDHQGWNLDNRWVRLLNIGRSIEQKEDMVTVYNGLDFLMACSAFYYSELGYPGRER